MHLLGHQVNPSGSSLNLSVRPRFQGKDGDSGWQRTSLVAAEPAHSLKLLEKDRLALFQQNVDRVKI